MKRFNSLIEAMREVKALTEDLTGYESIFLAIDYWGDQYYVAEEDYDISEAIEKDFHENCSDSTPENVAKEWKVIEYVNASKKERYPRLYTQSHTAKFNNGTNIIRRLREIEPEYSVRFNIS